MNVHFVSIRKKYQIDFDFVSFYSNMKFSILKLRCSLSLRYGCDLGPGHHFIVILTRQHTFQSKFLASARHYSILLLSLIQKNMSLDMRTVQYIGHVHKADTEISLPVEIISL